jgi:hypothetical protein
MGNLTINYHNANANEITNSLIQVDNKLKKSTCAYLCVQQEGDVTSITVVGLWTKLGQVVGSWFGKEDKTSEKNLDKAFSEILAHNKDLIGKEQFDKIQSISRHAHLISISDNKKNQTIEAVAKDIHKVADFLREKESILEESINSSTKSFKAIPIQEIKENIVIQLEEAPLKEDTVFMPTATPDPIPQAIIEEKALSEESDKEAVLSSTIFPKISENLKDSSEIGLQDYQEDHKQHLTQQNDEENPDFPLENLIMSENNPSEENPTLQEKQKEMWQPKSEISLHPDLKTEQKESSYKNFLLAGTVIAITTLVAHYFTPNFLQDIFSSSSDFFNKTSKSITNSLSHATMPNDDWHKNHIFIPIKGTSTSVQEGLSVDELQSLQNRTVNPSISLTIKEKQKEAESQSIKSEAKINLMTKQIAEATARIEAAIQTKEIVSIKELFPDLLTIAETNPQLVENVLLKALESDEWETLKLSNIRSLPSKNEKTYLEVAEELFARGKGEAIVEKAFNLYLKLDKNSKNIFFLQQILETAIENNLFNKDLEKKLSVELSGELERTDSFAYSNQVLDYHFPLRLVEKLHHEDYWLEFFPKNSVRDLILSYIFARDPNKLPLIENSLMKSSQFSEIDHEIANLLFDKSNAIHARDQKLINHLIDNNSGHETLNKILENNLDSESSNFMIDVINCSPQLIADFFVDDQKLTFTKRVSLQELISIAISENKLNSEIIAEAFSKAIENKKLNDHILRSIQTITQKLPDGAIKNALSNQIEEKLEIIKRVYSIDFDKALFAYKTSADTEVLKMQFQKISKLINSADQYVLEEIDKSLAKTIMENKELMFKNSNEIFNHDNEYSIYHLAIQLIKKGEENENPYSMNNIFMKLKGEKLGIKGIGKETASAIAKIFMDPKFEKFTSSNKKFLIDACKTKSLKIIEYIDVDLATHLSSLSSTDFKYIEEKVTLTEFTDVFFANADEFITSKEYSFLLDLTISNYCARNKPTVLQDVKYSQSVTILISAIKNLPEKFKHIIARDILQRSAGINMRTLEFPEFSKLYELLNRDQSILNFAKEGLKDPYITPNARKEFEKIVNKNEGL